MYKRTVKNSERNQAPSHNTISWCMPLFTVSSTSFLVPCRKRNFTFYVYFVYFLQITDNCLCILTSCPHMYSTGDVVCSSAYCGIAVLEYKRKGESWRFIQLIQWNTWCHTDFTTNFKFHALFMFLDACNKLHVISLVLANLCCCTICRCHIYLQTACHNSV